MPFKANFKRKKLRGSWCNPALIPLLGLQDVSLGSALTLSTAHGWEPDCVDSSSLKLSPQGRTCRGAQNGGHCAFVSKNTSKLVYKEMTRLFNYSSGTVTRMSQRYINLYQLPKTQSGLGNSGDEADGTSKRSRKSAWSFTLQSAQLATALLSQGQRGTQGGAGEGAQLCPFVHMQSVGGGEQGTGQGLPLSVTELTGSDH
ncbi:hypothetical protein JZ751_013661 [Albula glossodonta]|uniref:Uncharacterized protein n=1 Tax=Albula glossodonta TaxID=121402 RepID=A0A8T2NT10_9TELE|nr:hypothetical protein JZ751_013661 [Albula glossodonta]